MKKYHLYQFKIHNEEKDNIGFQFKDKILLFLEFGGSFGVDDWTFLTKEGIVNWTLPIDAILDEKTFKQYLKDEILPQNKPTFYLKEICCQK